MPATKEVDLWVAVQQIHVPTDAHKATFDLEHTTLHITANGLMPLAELPVPSTRAAPALRSGVVVKSTHVKQHPQRYVRQET